MSGPEDRVARHLERLLRRRRPPRFQANEDELAAVTAAAALAAARPGADLPDPAYVERLGRRLRAELDPAPARASQLSRRRLLQTAGVSAVAALAGAVLDHSVVAEMSAVDSATVVPNGGSWRPVAALNALPDGAVMPVATGSMRVLVVNQGGRISALSGVCTHLGCSLQPAAEAGRISCPCHRTVFSLGGRVVDHQLAGSPGNLPAVQSRVREGQIEVFVV